MAKSEWVAQYKVRDITMTVFSHNEASGTEVEIIQEGSRDSLSIYGSLSEVANGLMRLSRELNKLATRRPDLR